jgi:hypothetical protein
LEELERKYAPETTSGESSADSNGQTSRFNSRGGPGGQEVDGVCRDWEEAFAVDVQKQRHDLDLDLINSIDKKLVERVFFVKFFKEIVARYSTFRSVDFHFHF